MKYNMFLVLSLHLQIYFQRRQWLFKVGGQEVLQVVMRRGGVFYSAKKWGSNCPPCPPFTDASDFDSPLILI